ncbi:Tpcn1, partial [Symbiodinium microadriaticum]
QALIAIHEILSDERGYISRCTWLGFCSRINGKYAVKKNFADLLFNLECMQLSGSEPDDSAEDVIDCEGLFRLCALLSTRVRVIVPAIRTQATNSAGIVKDQSHDGAVEIGANEGGQVAPPQQPHTRRHSSVAQLVHHTGGDSSGSDTDEDVVEGEETADAIGEKLLTGPGGGDPQEGIKRKRSRSRSKGASRAYGESAIDAELTLQDYWDDLRDMGRCAVSYCFPVHAAVPYLRHWSATPGKDSSAVQKCLHWVSTVSICPWNIFFILVRGMLVAQLFLVSTSDRKEWVYLGWAIEGLFWLEMLVLICSIGWGKYLKRNGYGYVMTLNIGSLIVMILIGSSTRQDGYKYYSLLVIQMCRFFRFSRFLKGFKTFYAITPLILRMFFIIFAIIYIFADFAHNRMCNTLNPDNIHDEDDDSEQWLGYQHVLNFKTYLQSVLTLYEVATLGNWSPIMGAAAQTDPVLSLLFFYTYRLTMTLAVFPLLFAFIIQAFITRRDLDDQDKGKTSPSPDGVSSTCGATAERAKLSDSPSGHGCLKYRRQLYSNMLEFDNWTNGRDDQNTKRPAETRPVSSSDLSGSTAKSFSAHRFASMASGGHVNSLNPPDDSASFTDMTSPITTSRYRRRRPESFPARSPISPARSDGGGYKVEKEIDKGTSMMAFWAQGEKTTSDAQKDKNRVMMLQRMLDDTLEQLAMERKANLAKEAAYQETLRKLTAKSEGLK